MASELRVNSSTNRSGLGTITYTDSGPIVSGVGTFTNGFTVDGTQTTVKSLKLTGDNYNANWFKTSSTFRLNDNAKLNIGSADDMQQYHDGTTSYIKNTTGGLRIENTASNIGIYASDSNGDIIMRAGGATSSENAIVAVHHGEVTLAFNGSTKLTTTNTGLTLTGIINGPTQLNLSNTGGDLINVTSTTAASRSTIKFNTNGNDWEIGARGSSADNPNNFYFFDNATTSYRMLIGSNGYVNIGTGAPEQQLTVQNSAQHSLIRVISKNDSDAGIDFGDVDDTDRAGIRYTNSTDTLSINANANTRVVIDSSGRVMIGGGSSPAQVGDGRLIVYSTDRLHPAIKPAGMINNYANGWTLLGDNYQADESQINLGLSYSSSSLVLSRGVKVSGSADNTYLSSQDSYATRPCAIRMDEAGAFNFLTTETNAATTVDSAVSLTEVFKIDRVGNVYQKISGRNIYLGSSSQLRLGVQTNGDPNIEAVSGDLKLMKNGSSIMQLRADGFEMKQDIYFGTAGKGIVLGNTSNVDANTLDDYEEGSFSPTLVNGNNGYRFQQGTYTKVGNLVTFTAYIETSATPPSGNLAFGGLPFASIGSRSWVFPFHTNRTSFGTASFDARAYLGGTDTNVYIYYPVNSSSSNFQPINQNGMNAANASAVWITGSYQTSA